MSRVHIAGLGAVSPAGWTMAEFRAALEGRTTVPVQSLWQPGSQRAFPACVVPTASPRPAFLAHPRMRRAAPIAHYVVSAALEALAAVRPALDLGARLGLVVCLQSGCVQFSCQFYEEVLRDPSLASPLVFPETVFAALASHLGALLGNAPLTSSIVGDPAGFLQGVAVGATWLAEERVDFCLVIGAEESHWVLADALRQYNRTAIISCGAGAVCLAADPARSLGVELTAISDSHTFVDGQGRIRAARTMRAQLPVAALTDLLCDGLTGDRRVDAAEEEVWRDWPGPRLSVKRILGEGLAAASAWQCVAACDALAQGRAPAAVVSLVGSNQQAIGAQFRADALS